MPSISTQSPFPKGGLSAAYAWHTATPTCINGRNHTYGEFVALMQRALSAPGARSWGVSLDGELLGMVIFDPIYRGRELSDGSIHMAIARSAWGKGIIDAVAGEIIPELFNGIPSLLRLTGFTAGNYRPSLALGERLGFRREGIIRDGVQLDNRTLDIIVSGLTRGDWEKAHGTNRRT